MKISAYNVFSTLGDMAGVGVNHYVVSSLMVAFAGIFAFIFCPVSEKKTLEEFINVNHLLLQTFTILKL